MSDRIAVMNEGRLEQIGTPRQIYDAPASVFVAGFIGIANLIPATVRRVTGTLATVELAGEHCLGAAAGDGVFQPGAAAMVMVRPERLRLGETAPAGGEALPVTLEQAVFQGPVTRYGLRAADGTEIVAHVPAGRTVPALRPGLPLWVSWDAAAARLLPPVVPAAEAAPALHAARAGAGAGRP